MCGLRVVNSLPVEGWHEFLAGNANSNIFHTPEIFEVFAETTGLQPALWAVVDEESCPKALLLPVQISLFSGPLHSLSTRNVVYGSVIWDQDQPGLDAIELLLHTYASQARGKALFTELRNLGDLADVQPALQRHGFQYADHLNYLIDLNRTPEALMRSIGARTRKNIRRALRDRKVVIEELTDEHQLKPWYEVLQQTYRNARVPLADLSLFQAAYEILQPKGMIRFTQARVGTAIAATSVELLYRDVVYGWYGGIDRRLRTYDANELLMWHILAWGAEHGYTTYDFGGAGVPGQAYGPRDFKAKFHGRLVNYGRNTLISAPARLWLSKAAYAVYRQFI